MIDTHCHLSDSQLLDQIDAVMHRAATAGVTEICTIGTEPSDWMPALGVTKRYSNVRCALGVHPCYCHEVQGDFLTKLRELAVDPGVVAIGEMGLDYFHAEAPKDLQRKFFISQLELATELKKPVVIHSRNAINDCLTVMKDFSKITAVYHCFTGNSGEADRIIEQGYCIGFTGVVTFKNAPDLREIAARVPVERILVETDAPWLTPEPMRKQKVNEPALVAHVGAAVAAARGVAVGEIDRITTENAKRLYRWE